MANDYAEALGDATAKTGRVLLVFVGVAVLAVVAFGPALAVPYAAFRYGGAGQYRELVALGGILGGAVVAFLFSRPVFAYGSKYLGDRAR